MCAGAMDPIRGPIGRMLMSATAERIELLLARALVDPKMAKALMMKATPKNQKTLAKLVAPALRIGEESVSTVAE